MLKKAEWITSCLLTGVIVVLLVVRTMHAGGMWRDECAAVQLARMPTLAEVVDNFEFEAFPLLFPGTIRLYSNIFGTSDTAFRAFGLVVGLLLVAALWFNALLLYRGPPLVSLVLAGLSTTVLTWATTIRGYGLGTVFILLTLGLFGKLLETPTRRWKWTAFFAALISVHYLLNNSFLLLAMGGAAILASLLRTQFRTALTIAAIGVICAITMLPYVGPYSSGNEWNMVVKFPVSLIWLWSRFSMALAGQFGIPIEGIFEDLTTDDLQRRILSRHGAMVGVWILTFVLAVLGGARYWSRTRHQPDDPRRPLVLYGVLTAFGTLVCYYAFLRLLSYPTQVWYYITPICVLAATVDLLSGLIIQKRWQRIARIGAVLAAGVALTVAGWPKLVIRQTNIDLAARYLEEHAAPDDLILVNPWFLGVTFNWYYHGPTPWLTTPILKDVRTHRYDLVKAKMTSSDPLEHVFRLITEKLQAGKRIWLVGGVALLEEGVPPMRPGPAPDRVHGWKEYAYMMAWSEQMGEFFKRHVAFLEVALPPQSDPPVSGMENAPVWVIRGWYRPPEEGESPPKDPSTDESSGSNAQTP